MSDRYYECMTPDDPCADPDSCDSLACARERLHLALRDGNVHEWAERIEAARISGYAAGVQDARDAVADVRAQAPQPFGEFIYREVLPAIDALRGDA